MNVQLNIDVLGIATITLNRPNKANALSQQLLIDLTKAIEQISQDENIRVIVLTSSGDKAFCAGADLKERAVMNEKEVKQTVELIGRTLNRLEALKKPVIAAINGVALGGGLELALACDIRFASNKAKFGLTETSLGIIPGAGGTQRLPRLIGKGKAKELIFTAKVVDAIEANHLGIVEYVVEENQLLSSVYDFAQKIAKNAPIAITQAKYAINKGYEVELEKGLLIESEAYEFTIHTKDRLEGLQAFKEKRKPKFSGE